MNYFVILAFLFIDGQPYDIYKGPGSFMVQGGCEQYLFENEEQLATDFLQAFPPEVNPSVEFRCTDENTFDQLLELATEVDETYI